MNCSQCRELISQYLDGVLSETIHRAMENHLHSCPACREELEAMEQTIEIIRAWSEEELDLPPGFGERLRVRLKESCKPWYRRLSQSGLTLAAAAAIIMVVAITARADYLNFGLLRETAVSQEKQAQGLTMSREDLQVTPLLTLPPVTSTAAAQQRAQEVTVKAATTPVRTAMGKPGGSQPDPEQQQRKIVPGGAFSLNSRGRAERTAPDQQPDGETGKVQPDQDSNKGKEQQPGSPEQEPENRSRVVLKGGNKEKSPGTGEAVASGTPTTTGNGPGAGKILSGDGQETPPLPPDGGKAPNQELPPGGGRQNPAASSPDNNLQSHPLTQPLPAPAAAATISKPPSP